MPYLEGDLRELANVLRTILGENPKSSLLFGAPAISLRQIEAALPLGQVHPAAASLLASDVLPIAAQVAEGVFSHTRHAQLRTLVRGGEREEWIVFRPALPGVKPSHPGQLSLATAPKIAPIQPQHEIAQESSSQASATWDTDKENVKARRKLFRPFFKSKDSGDSPVTSTVVQPAKEEPFTLPPAHKIGSGAFEQAWIPLVHPESVPPGQPLPMPAPVAPDPHAVSRRTGPSYKLPPVPRRSSSPRPPLATEVSKHEQPLKQGGALLFPDARVPLESTPSYLAISRHRRAKHIIYSPPSSASDSHTAAQADPVLVNAKFSAAELGERETRNQSHSRPASHCLRPSPINTYIQAEATAPSTLIVTISPSSHRKSSPAALNAPAVSPLIMTSISSTSSDDRSSQSPTSPVALSSIDIRPLTPWLRVAFRDLPFAPDSIPAFHSLDWAKDRWQILGAELVVILGAVYIIQTLAV